MSDTVLAAEVHATVEPGLSAVIDGLDVLGDALGVLTTMVGQVLAAHAALAAQMAAQHDAQMRAIAALVVRQSGL